MVSNAGLLGKRSGRHDDSTDREMGVEWNASG